MTIQQRNGLFPRLLGKGPYAHRLVELLLRTRTEDAASEGASSNGVPKTSAMPSSDIDSLIVIDRSVDFSSGLLTQLTYEGLVDEEFGISHGQVELENSFTGLPTNSFTATETNTTTPAASSKRKVRLDGNDKLYASLRDANFAIVGGLLNRVARRLQSDYEERHGSKTTAELRDFVSKLPAYQAEQQSLKIHTNLAEEVLKKTHADMFRRVLEVQQNLAAGVDASAVHDIIEDLIARDCPLPTVLRLLCLESTINGGLRQKDYEVFRREIVQAYGYQHLLTLDALEKMGLFQLRPSSGAFTIPGAGLGAAAPTGQQTNYSALRRPLQLVMDELSEQEPEDIAYVFSGYAPLSVRLVQCILQKQYVSSLGRSNASAAAGTLPSDVAQGWRGFEDLLKNVKGKTVDEVQISSDRSSRAKQVLEGRGGKKTSIVFFLGGITFAEIAALRYIAKQEEDRRHIVICTTSIISGDKMMQAAINTSNIKQK